MLPAERDEEVEVALPSISEPEVVPRHHHPDPEAGDEKRFDEFDGRHGAETGVEAQQRDPVERQCAERAQLLPQPREARRGIVSREELLRLRLEGDEGGGNAAFAAERRKLPDQRPMAEMHPIEVPDGGDAAVMLGSDVVPAANQLQLEPPCRTPTRRRRNRIVRTPLAQESPWR